MSVMSVKLLHSFNTQKSRSLNFIYVSTSEKNVQVISQKLYVIKCIVFDYLNVSLFFLLCFRTKWCIETFDQTDGALSWLLRQIGLGRIL